MQILFSAKKIRLANTGMWIWTVFIFVEVGAIDFEYDKEETKLIESFNGVWKTEAELVDSLFGLLDEITHSLKKVVISTVSAEYIFKESNE